MPPGPPPRLHPLQALEAPVVVVFRRGPSRWVELVRWQTDTDTVARGQWFRGRIYERRSDLSPDGRFLVYFASRFTRRAVPGARDPYAWTAISRPPWLTALALWPKADAWAGGGLFLGRRELLLNHSPEEVEPHPEHRPRGLKVTSTPGAHGEDEPIFSRRLTRDGWQVAQEWRVEFDRDGLSFRTDVPELRQKSHPAHPFSITLERRLDGLEYREAFRVSGPAGAIELPAGRIDWADWDARGRLFVLHAGRVDVAEVGLAGAEGWRTVIDLAGDRPEPRRSPGSARSW